MQLPRAVQDLSLDSIRSVDSSTLVKAGVGAGLAVGAAYLGVRMLQHSLALRPKRGPFTPQTLPEGAYDAVIVGAGPAGSVCAHYLASGGARVALLDKEHFPRDKICGDALCGPAINILRDIGVLQELVAADEAHFADNGGLVSPAGHVYIGNSQHVLGTAAMCAVKRLHLDERVARCAARAGAQLMEGFEVGEDVSFDPAAGLWTVKSTDGKTVRARVLVCADGTTSRIATRLGLCTAPPVGVCSRSYIEGGSHNFSGDGVIFYPRWSLPGYGVIVRHAKDELGFCYYLIPCGKDADKGQLGNVTAEDLRWLHENAIKHDPFISRAMGPNPKCERMRAGPLRVGGQGLNATYGDHLMIIGDAAGHTDPLTGEGIHTAMMGGKAAAEVLLQLREVGDFSARNTQLFQEKWMQLYGHDFKLSQKGAELMWRYPILLDACCSELQRQGDAMLAKWGEVMTNMRPKSYFFQPHVAIPLGFAIVRELWAQKVLGRPGKYDMPAATLATNGINGHK